jgi:hypothetical protein
MLLAASAFSASSRVHYVKLGATGLNNGTSWANAFTSFDSVCSYVRPDTLNPDTFWVANGIYKTHGYRMRNKGLKIYGGFNGTETSLSQRHLSGFQTVLDGDLGSPGVVTDNAQAILVVEVGILDTLNVPAHPYMILDGFKFANSYQGVGVSYECDSLDTVEFANCLFSNHVSGIYGSAFRYRLASAFANSSVGMFRNCHFENNSGANVTNPRAFQYGWGAAVQVYTPYVVAFGSTGLRTRLLITDCTFINNTAPYGGAIANMDSSVSVEISRCVFKGNTATVAGGVIYDTSWSKTAVYNSLFIGNSAPRSSVWHQGTRPAGSAAPPRKLIGCTVASNKSTSASSTDYAIILNGKDSIENCIFWDNITGSGRQLSPPTGPAFISTNIIQGGMTGSLATVTLNPLFVSPGSGSAAPFSASASYDYHLANASPAIDLGLTNITAPAGLNNLDLDNNARTFGPAPDLGAYEQTYCLLPTVRITPASVFICLSSEDSVLLTASGGAGAGSYTWIGRGISGGAAIKGSTLWAKDSGVYHVMSYDSVSGCRAQASVNVRVVPKMKPVITRTGSVLSVPAVYSSYQWYKGGVVIAGATSNSYTPTSNGLYSIWVSIRGAECTDSASYNMTNVGVGGSIGAGASEVLSVYPNPANRFITIEGAEGATAVLVSSIGQRVMQFSLTAEKEVVDISALPSGVYILQLTDTKGNRGAMSIVKQ